MCNYDFQTATVLLNNMENVKKYTLYPYNIPYKYINLRKERKMGSKM